MVITRRVSDDTQYVQNLVKKTQNHVAEGCIHNIKCQENNLAFGKSCCICKKEKEILEIKHRRNVSLSEARKIVYAYMKGSNKTDKYKALIVQLVQLGSNYLPKHQELLKRKSTTENCHTEIIKIQEPISNLHAVAQVPTVQNKIITQSKKQSVLQISKETSLENSKQNMTN